MCPSESQQRLQYGITFDEIYVRTDAEVDCKNCQANIDLSQNIEFLEGDPVLGDFRVVLRPNSERWAAANAQRKRDEQARRERQQKTDKETRPMGLTHIEMQALSAQVSQAQTQKLILDTLIEIGKALVIIAERMPEKPE